MANYEIPEEEAELAVIDQLCTVTRLFGRPPLLSSEKLEDYEGMMRRLFACIRPEDFVISLLVYQVGVETWCAMRWRRFQAVMINRWEQASAEMARQHEKLQEQRKANQGEPPELFKDAPNESCRHIALSPLWDRVADELTTLQGCTKEVKLVAAFERGTDKLQKAESLTDECLKRRDSALSQIEWYRASLAREVRRASDAVIEKEGKKEIENQAEDAPLVPVNGEAL